LTDYCCLQVLDKLNAIRLATQADSDSDSDSDWDEDD
jgi:hypothetical protein